MEWFDERIPRMEHGNWLYKFICFCTGLGRKKMSYKQYYLMLCHLNEKTLGLEEAKTAALIRVLKLYKYLHDGNLPEGVEEDG